MTTSPGLVSRLVGRATDALLGLPAASTASTASAGHTVERGIAVPMSDGVSLLGDLYRPSGARGPLPVVLIRSPYGRGGLNELVFAGPIARRGFQVFLQSTRGTFGSGGHFHPVTGEREDGLQTIAWLREQEWCDGRVATTGPSYLGHTQWAVAPYVDPPLVAASLHVTSASFTEVFYDHGVPQLLNALNWSTALGTQERSPIPAVLDPRVRSRIRRAAASLPLQAADTAVVGAPVTFWRDFVEHDAHAEHWAGADHSGADLSTMPPVSMVSGWWDLFCAGQLADFAALRAAGNDARIVIGPWAHSDTSASKVTVQDTVEWLEHHLHGRPRTERSPVRAYLQQTDSWLDLDQWPPAGAVSTTRYLTPGGGLAVGPVDGPVDAGVGESSSRYRYDPADPTPGVGGPLLATPNGQADNTEVEARDDVLVFTGDVLPEDLDVVGQVRSTVHVRPELDHCDLFVRLCDVDAAGVSRNVVDGIRRLEPRTVPAPDVRVGPDGVLEVDVELFPTAYRFAAGHRMRVQVSGGAFPRYARNHGTGEALGTATAGVAGSVDVLHDAQHPSSITFDALG